MTGPLFVGGTGRCGTSQLTRVLGEHPQVHALEWESRFLVDPGGFEDLTRALTAAYTPYHADDALTRLAWLLNVRLTGHSDEAFRGWGLAEELGIEHYRAAVGRLRSCIGSCPSRRGKEIWAGSGQIGSPTLTST